MNWQLAGAAPGTRLHVIHQGLHHHNLDPMIGNLVKSGRLLGRPGGGPVARQRLLLNLVQGLILVFEVLHALSDTQDLILVGRVRIIQYPLKNPDTGSCYFLLVFGQIDLLTNAPRFFKGGRSGMATTPQRPDK